MLGVLAGVVVGGAIGAGIVALIGVAITGASALLSASYILGSYLTTSGAQAVVSVGGTQIAAATVLSLGVMFAATRMGPGKNSNNQAQNKEIDYMQNKYGLSASERRTLHNEITGQGYTKKMIEELIKIMFGRK
jgi:hypothetical protein